jgi:hypothetical protein
MIKDKSDLQLSVLESEDRASKRKALETKADLYLSSLKEQVGDVKTIGKNALIISGVVLTTYFLVDSLLGDSDEDENKPPSPNNTDSVLGSMIKGIATTALLALAKEQLMKFLDKEDQREKAD